jgi:hypothetical protein
MLASFSLILLCPSIDAAIVFGLRLPSHEVATR